MNRIVRENYPVSKLPEELRIGLAEDRPVSIVIIQEELASSQVDADSSFEEPITGGDFSRFKHFRRANFTSSAEIDDYLDALRNEWAHRER